MSSSTNPFVTPFENTSLGMAHRLVIQALSMNDPKYTLKMLRVFYGATARKDIIEECEKTYKAILRSGIQESAPIGYTISDSCIIRLRHNEALEEKVMQFYFQVTTLLNEKGFTEFMKVKPRYESKPTI